MTARSALRALVGGIGLAAGCVFGAAAAAAALVALGLPAASRADEPLPAPVAAERPNELVVALGLENPVMQAGAVRGGDVILARGLEVDIARALAGRLGIRRVRFVYVRPASRLLAAGSRSWHLTLSSIRPVKAVAGADLSLPYLVTDQAVVPRRGLPGPATLNDLRKQVTCALRGSDGARALTASVSPSVRPILAPSDDRLFELVRTGACDAALVDMDEVGRFVAGKAALVGPVRARIGYGGGYVVAVTRGGPVAVTEVDRALTRMRADGTLRRLTRRWLGVDPSRLRALR